MKALFERFCEVRICIQLVPGLSHPMTSIPHCVTRNERRLLAETHYTIRYSGGFLWLF